jgi:hypothetical protein
MLDKLRAQNEKEHEVLGTGFFVLPASTNDIDECNKKANTLFSLSLSEDYISILKATDGFSCNGFNLYGCKQKHAPYFIDGILDANLEFWEEESLRKYFSYSEESTTRIVFNIESQMYEIVDRVSWDELYSFTTFKEALEFNLEDSCIFLE